ncbi:MAG: hypothetical protein RLZZ271_785 [Pseudomonadota bacterium]|jgi:cell division protein FtsN
MNTANAFQGRTRKMAGAASRTTLNQRQQGSTLIGIIVGLVVGLAIALGVAMYVTKAPISFAQKTQNRTAEQDAQEARKNKEWDPNTSLHGKNPVKPAANAASGPVTPGAPAPAPAVSSAGKATTATAPAPADPLGDLAQAKAQQADAPGFYVQAGAFRSAPEAETQRAKVALAGVDAKVVERTQSGQPVHRVRVGPFDKREEADKIKQKLETAGVEALVVKTGR